MAHDNESRLVSALVRHEDVRTAVDRGVRPDWFHVADHRMVYEWLIDYYNSYGTTPSAATLKDNFPGYPLVAVTDPTDYFVDQLVAYNREHTAGLLAKVVVEGLRDKDHEKALVDARALLDKASSFHPIPMFHTDLSATVVDRWNSYKDRKASGSSLLGYETGYPVIDAATLGLQPQQLIVVLAEAKRGKTTLMTNIAIHVHHAYSESPMFISFEMSRRELSLRHDAIRAGVPLSSFLAGTLLPVEESRLGDMYADLHEMPPFVLADASQGVTVSSVAAQVEAHDPAVVFVDGVYLMTDERTGEVNTPQALTNLTRDFKRLAQDIDRPVVISTQALTWKVRKGRLAGDSAGYSSSFSQDADVMLGLEAGESDTTRRLRIVLSRNSGVDDTDINFDYMTGDFGQVIV